MGLWMLFVFTTSVADIAWGAGSAAFTTGLVWIIRRFTQHSIRPRARWLPGALVLAPRLFQDTATVFVALARHLLGRQAVQGAFRAVRYQGVYSSEAEASAGDGFVILANSLTPNTIVLDIDRVEGLLLVHQLVPQSPEQTAEQLVRVR
ncbi:MAG TPA: Na+/H+ antiporter subunit E [Chloroflexota bacterium]|nr:Na+/H+ antiporter subunit E [Chloroflexota bacterium]